MKHWADPFFLYPLFRKTSLPSRHRNGKVQFMEQSSNVLDLDESLLESAARCLDRTSVRALAGLKLDETSKTRLDALAQKANEGQLSPDETREYDRFIELADIIATLRLKAERHLSTVGT